MYFILFPLQDSYWSLYVYTKDLRRADVLNNNVH